MLPAIAATAITRYTRPGDLVADPMCSIGTTLVEAIHLGRDGIGIEYEDRWAAIAAANINWARPQGAAGTGQVICGDARQLPALLPPGTAGKAALVVTSPPYGPSVHGQVRAEQRHGSRGGVEKYDNRYSHDPAKTWPTTASMTCSPDLPRSCKAAGCCCGPAGWPWSPPGPGATTAS